MITLKLINQAEYVFENSFMDTRQDLKNDKTETLNQAQIQKKETDKGVNQSIAVKQVSKLIN